MKSCQILIAVLILSITSISQSQLSNNQVGSQMQDVNLKNIVNYKKTSTKLSQFNYKKLLLIDFFATWCIPCVKELPKMDSLQKKFKGQIQILAVTQQKKGMTENFLTTRKMGGSIPFVTEDSILNKTFQHLIIPHVIWINEQGTIIAITSNNEVTEENIKSILDKKKISLKEKVDVLKFDQTKPLFFDGNVGDGTSFMYRSLLLKGNSGMPGGGYSDMNWLHEDQMKIKRYFGFNRTPLNLFLIAFNLGSAEGTVQRRIILDVKDTSKYTGAPGMKPTPNELNFYMDWFWANAFTYELIVPEPISDTIFFRNMLEDINRFFPLKGKIIKKEIPCLVLKRIIPNDSLLKTSGKEAAFLSSPQTKLLRSMQNISLDKLVGFLNRFSDVDPIINETKFSNHVDLELNISYGEDDDYFNHLDVQKLNNALRKYGLALIAAKRELNVLWLTDKNSF